MDLTKSQLISLKHNPVVTPEDSSYSDTGVIEQVLTFKGKEGFSLQDHTDSLLL